MYILKLFRILLRVVGVLSLSLTHTTTMFYFDNYTHIDRRTECLYWWWWWWCNKYHVSNKITAAAILNFTSSGLLTLWCVASKFISLCPIMISTVSIVLHFLWMKNWCPLKKVVNFGVPLNNMLIYWHLYLIVTMIH